MLWHPGFKNMAPKLSVRLHFSIFFISRFHFQLSHSLFVTTVVLFGLVDSHDLTGLLEVVLEEVKTQTPLQQEENCSAFLQRGGRCFMEQRMYRAQIEVSLFSKAIANLCEELNTRSQPGELCR
jgi:hypothetical protein